MKNTEIWIFLFILGLLGINWPILEIFRIHLVAYLFAFWLFFIVTVAFATYKSRKWEAGIRK